MLVWLNLGTQITLKDSQKCSSKHSSNRKVVSITRDLLVATTKTMEMTSKKVLPISITTKSKITRTVLGSKQTMKKRENLPKKPKKLMIEWDLELRMIFKRLDLFLTSLPQITRKRSLVSLDNISSRVSRPKMSAQMKESITMKVCINSSKVPTVLMRKFSSQLYLTSLERLKLRRNTAFSMESCAKEKLLSNYN